MSERNLNLFYVCYKCFLVLLLGCVIVYVYYLLCFHLVSVFVILLFLFLPCLYLNCNCQYLSVPFLFLIFFIIEGDFVSFNGQANSIYLDWFQQIDVVSNIETLGQVLYTDYLVYFLLAGVILLVAMGGAIVLTMSTRTSLRRQLIFQQKLLLGYYPVNYC